MAQDEHFTPGSLPIEIIEMAEMSSSSSECDSTSSSPSSFSSSPISSPSINSFVGEDQISSVSFTPGISTTTIVVEDHNNPTKNEVNTDESFIFHKQSQLSILKYISKILVQMTPVIIALAAISFSVISYRFFLVYPFMKQWRIGQPAAKGFAILPRWNIILQIVDSLISDAANILWPVAIVYVLFGRKILKPLLPWSIFILCAKLIFFGVIRFDKDTTIPATMSIGSAIFGAITSVASGFVVGFVVSRRIKFPGFCWRFGAIYLMFIGIITIYMFAMVTLFEKLSVTGRFFVRVLLHPFICEGGYFISYLFSAPIILRIGRSCSDELWILMALYQMWTSFVGRFLITRFGNLPLSILAAFLMNVFRLFMRVTVDKRHNYFRKFIFVVAGRDTIEFDGTHGFRIESAKSSETSVWARDTRLLSKFHSFLAINNQIYEIIGIISAPFAVLLMYQVWIKKIPHDYVTSSATLAISQLVIEVIFHYLCTYLELKYTTRNVVKVWNTRNVKRYWLIQTILFFTAAYFFYNQFFRAYYNFFLLSLHH